jgi:dTMP kinase
MVSNAEAGQRGYLIAVEGCDRTGKSTQCHALRGWLAARLSPDPAHPDATLVEYWKFPDRTTPLGGIINAYLSGSADLPDEAIHLLFSANRWEVRDKMLETLQSGRSIILDRYVPSGVAYSAAKGMNLEWCKAPDAGLPAPDLVLFLDLPAEVAQARAGYGEERYERVEFQARVRQLFKALQDDTWAIVDGNQTPEALSTTIQDVIHDRLLSEPLAEAMRTIAWQQ